MPRKPHICVTVLMGMHFSKACITNVSSQGKHESSSAPVITIARHISSETLVNDFEWFVYEWYGTTSKHLEGHKLDGDE